MKVVTPAIISVRTVEPCSFTLKKLLMGKIHPFFHAAEAPMSLADSAFIIGRAAGKGKMAAADEIHKNKLKFLCTK